MIHLIKNEFIKIRKSKVFYMSFIIMTLSPMSSFFAMSLEPQDFSFGDFNRINLILLSLIGSRTIFPVIAMALVKIEYDVSGYESSFVTPVKRSKVMIAKALTALTWMMVLVFFTIVMVLISEIALFGNFAVGDLLTNTIRSYFYIIVYTFPIQIFGMLLTFVFNNILIPSMFFGVFIIIEYFVRISGKMNYTPCVIPEFISGSLEFSLEIIIAFSTIIIFGLVSLFALNHLIRNKDFLK